MMPNKTIYVADADLPVFERAQELAGDNLSSTIAKALRVYIEAREGKYHDFEEVTLQVGKITRTNKQFIGRLLAKGKLTERTSPEVQQFKIYQTRKEKFVLHVKRSPNWNYRPGPDQPRVSLSEDDTQEQMEIFDTLDELKRHIPEELYQAAAQAMSDEPFEFLDI
jgi:EXLDI family protein